VDVIILHDEDNIPQRESPHRSLMCAGAVILMACCEDSSIPDNFINDSNELLPTLSTIHKMVLALSLTLNYLTHSDNPKNSKYRGTL
jgi:hypothetical protein